MFLSPTDHAAPVIYSASDLAAAARCEYALLRRFDGLLGWGPKAVVDDDLLARTAELGDAHEQRHLEQLREASGDNVTMIGRPRPYTVAGLIGAAEATRAAVDRRAPVIYQAAMFDGRFLGFADFLILEDGRYRLRDTKLARSVKVEALLQLAAYADALEQAGVPVAPEVDLVLGDGTIASYPVAELLPVYLPRRAALQRLLDEHRAGGAPVSWETPTLRACHQCEDCEVEVRERDDLLLVAGMRVSQRARLLDAGITTMHQLAEYSGAVPGLSSRIVANLVGQARLQVAPPIDDKPQFEVIDAQPLTGLPEPDRGDLFFDYEGDPLWTENGRDWGLEYLWGTLTATGEFHPIWAHDRASERKALVDFLALVRKQRKRYPNMHIYHYAAYEKSTLLRLSGRYGVGEAEVDELLRSGVLVDLLPLVRKSIRVGTESYSIKYLEPLYMGGELRVGEVTKATDSITQYARYTELEAAGEHEEAATVLKEIEDYNHYDCRSTLRLREWLLGVAWAAGIAPRPQARGGLTQPETAALADDATQRALAKFAGDGTAARSDKQQAVAMIAAARGYHQREEKPFWWEHFDRINNPVDEWADCTDVFVATTTPHIAVDWNTPPKARKPQRQVLLRGEIAAGSVPPGAEVFALYEPPSPPGLSDDPDVRAAGTAKVLECNEDGTEVLIMHRAGKDGDQFPQLPFALTPGPPPNTKPLRNSIETTAADVAAGLPSLPPDAALDILLRSAPRTASTGPLPRTGDAARDIVAALRDLDSSYLAVHGPPGTGKTYTASKVIADLVNRDHWRIGVVAQSHAVVENVLSSVVKAGVDGRAVGKKRAPEDAPFTDVPDNQYARFIADSNGCVIGGTAWDFANDGRVPRGCLDLLVIEEAGQFSLANTIAVAPAARNLLLLGDPQQLPQVSQGTHPEPVDESALSWLVEGRHTLPAERGYFLDVSYRMHPAVCAPVSALSYDNRLLSAESVSGARRLAGIEPGVHLMTVDHEGNATDSREEAEAIIAAIGGLVGREWSDEDGTKNLGPEDVLIVAPYNAQVVLLRERMDAAGYGDVQVGTVDKFQGRQAPVVFVSMTASSIAEVPRGMAFLLNRNRLNVAISRAKYAAYVVRSTFLTDYLPSTPDGMIDLGAFLSVTGAP
ncbi:MAG: TM0106 family RecB-like putative nuclease [Mycolicibacterium sp.]|uniref:TM0106 family RecB-like putative nuclease n=1 Tax=Mycolicibacterium sp. TaxID=2320850 RepID=UPI000F9BC1FA|nr:TM0106 family RecB-like putative nuclease [Mycolicibacterium sp.]RUP28684.1 MAG: TM0106 family RecB-like putative nuclease [Mycolicibacterium sp.]